MAKYNNDYVVLGNDGLIDISSGSPVPADGYGDSYGTEPKSSRSGGMDPKKKKMIIIISSAAACLVALLAVAGIVIFNNINSNKPAEAESTVFSFVNKTVVSGVDITGKSMEQAKAALESSKKQFIKPIGITVSLGDETKELTQDNFEYTFNIDEVLKKAERDALNGVKPENAEEGLTYTVTATVTEDSVNKNVSEIGDSVDAEPEDAYVTEFHPYEENRFDFEEAKTGAKLNRSDLKKQLTQALSGGNSFAKISADIETEGADVSAAFLKNNLVKLASYETYSTNTENGTSNMRVALSSCNGSIIDPGEVWSFNECTGDSNLESNGYKSAHVISEGKIIDGIGGGICQASSTIYNAAIRANLEIEERYAHKWASNYVPTGFDATIDYPNLDLKLSNPSAYQVFLECKVVNNNLYATFWGVKTGDYDEIRTHNQLGEVGSSSYSVRAWRVYFKGGEEIDREELFRSSYDLANGVYFIEADNDNGAFDRDVDDEEESSSSSAPESSRTYENSDDEEETSAVVTDPPQTNPPQTEAPQTDPPQTEAQNTEAQQTETEGGE